jgi:hypothetical protein
MRPAYLFVPASIRALAFVFQAVHPVYQFAEHLISAPSPRQPEQNANQHGDRRPDEERNSAENQDFSQS